MIYIVYIKETILKAFGSAEKANLFKDQMNEKLKAYHVLNKNCVDWLNQETERIKNTKLTNAEKRSMIDHSMKKHFKNIEDVRKSFSDHPYILDSLGSFLFKVKEVEFEK